MKNSSLENGHISNGHAVESGTESGCEKSEQESEKEEATRTMDFAANIEKVKEVSCVTFIKKDFYQHFLTIFSMAGIGDPYRQKALKKYYLTNQTAVLLYATVLTIITFFHLHLN